MEQVCPKCPKCSSSENTYLFCKECNTHYCLVCCKEYYYDKTKNAIQAHNPECGYEVSSIDLSDFED